MTQMDQALGIEVFPEKGGESSEKFLAVRPREKSIIRIKHSISRNTNAILFEILVSDEFARCTPCHVAPKHFTPTF